MPRRRALARIEHDERVDAVKKLKPREREALYHKGPGYSYHEIAELTNSTDTALNRRISEARAALRHGGRGHDADGCETCARKASRRWCPSVLL